MRLAKHLEEIKEAYDVVVIGSGYGGSIAASRMARAGQSVCLLERGKEIRPGEYPDQEHEAVTEFQIDSPKKHRGKMDNLYEFHVNKEINVFKGCGLGGTSLVNANVSLEADERVFESERWPEALRRGTTNIKHWYKVAAGNLGSTPYPEDFPLPHKLANMETAAQYMGNSTKFYRPPINVNFKDGVNQFGVQQYACVGCGDCVTGCNFSAKNTTLMNYLPDAWNHGAEIFTQAKVSYIEKRADGKWLVHYGILHAGREKFDAPEQFVLADKVILSGGTLGSTEILLRSKANGLPLSDELGEHFSGNGDFLAFGYNNDIPANSVGRGHKSIDPANPPGPCIAGVIDLRGMDNLEDGMIIEEGVAPAAVSSLLTTSFLILSKTGGKDTDGGFRDELQEKLRAAKSLLGGAYRGAIHNTMVYLVMCHDDAKGRMHLVEDRLRISWPDAGKDAIYKQVEKALYKVTEALGGTYINNPIWSKALGHDLVTVHPLGGCVMGEDVSKGVVNHKGQVFSGETSAGVHEGLYVMDGSIVPMALGVNPLLTISALSERCCDHIAKDNGWSISYENKQVQPHRPDENLKPGIAFTERMKGFISQYHPDYGFEAAYEAGEKGERNLEFILTIHAHDVDRFLSDPEHLGEISGTVTCPLLDKEILSVHAGEFNLFKQDNSQVATLLMRYRMQLVTEQGKHYFFNGFKEVRDDLGFDLWKDTTTLFTQIYEGPDQKGELLYQGILRIGIQDFARQLATIKTINVDGLFKRLKWIAKFGKFFAGRLFHTYGGIFVKDTPFNPDAAPRKKRPLISGEPEIFEFATEDNVQLRLSRSKGGDKGPVMLVHGFGVNSHIFSIDTIEVNLVEYLYANGYDVWNLDWRGSIDLPGSEEQFNGDEVAQYDYPPAIDLILKETGADDIQVFAHCVGALTLTMSILQGLPHIRSLVISQVGPRIVGSSANRLKSKMRLPEVLGGLGVDSITAKTDSHSDWKAKLFNTLLRLYPVSGEEKTSSAVSNRITFLYGELYELDKLDQDTFDALHEMFGVANLDMFKHLTLMFREGKMVSHDSRDIYLPEIDRLNFPICFISGEENKTYHPDTTKESYELLKSSFPDQRYVRHVVQDYGHIDCIFGKDADQDVFPHILAHLVST